MKRADLHVHSILSDGTDSPARVVERAASHELAAIALTDHDTMAGIEEALEAGRRLGIEVIPGIELSTEHQGQEVHLLAYFVDRHDARLGSALARMQEARERRVERIVVLLNEQGIPVTLAAVRAFAGGRSIGRPHVADALVSGGFVPSYDIAWRDYLRPGGKACVERPRLAFSEALDLIRTSGGVSAIAHPTLNLSLEMLETVAGSGVHALETTHPKVPAAESAALSDLCRRRGLMESGGSDCHGARRGEPTMGRCSIPLERVDALRRLARARG